MSVDPDKLSFVCAFLERTLGTPVPEFDATADAVERLFVLAQRTLVATRIGTEERNDLRQRGEEYAAEGARQRAVLEAVGISPAMLSGAGRQTLHGLAHTASALHCPQANQSLLLEAVLLMQQRESLLADSRLALAQERRALTARLALLESQTAATRAAVAAAQPVCDARLNEAQRQAKELIYYEKKKAEYDGLLLQCEQHLAAVDFDPTVRHVECEKLFERLNQIEQECVPLQEELSRYHDLEPTLDAAQAKLESAKAALSMLKAQYSQAIAKIASIAE